MDERRLRRLLDVGRSLMTGLDPEAVFERLLDVARELTGARYAAIGVLDERRERLERFLTAGHRQGHPPRDRRPAARARGARRPDRRPAAVAPGGCGRASAVLWLPARPSADEHVPRGPDRDRGEAWGNLYLTEKDGGEFSEEDEEAAVVLADWAAIAIANARLYRDVRERRDELERTNRGLETTTEISRALGGVTDLDRVLELVVKRSRALIDARAAEIALLDGDELVIAAVAGEGIEGVRGMRIAVEGSLAGEALRSGQLQRIQEIPPHTFAYRELGARSALVTPMSFRGRPVGLLVVFDRLRGDRPFNAEDERLLEAFAASAAIAVATAQHAGDEALRRSLEASERERSRWARELHDETLQQLAALRVLLAGARRSGDRERLETAVGEAIEQLKTSDRGSALADHGPAAGGAGRVRRRARAGTLVARVAEQSDSPSRSSSTSAAMTARRGHGTRPRSSRPSTGSCRRRSPTSVKHARATRVQVERQRRGGQRRGGGTRRRRGLRSPARARPASGCSACASGWAWCTGDSRSSPRRVRGRRCTHRSQRSATARKTSWPHCRPALSTPVDSQGHTGIAGTAPTASRAALARRVR